MTKLKALLRDERGASMVEYSILIGLITAALVASVAGVGSWAKAKWDALCTATGATCTTP